MIRQATPCDFDSVARLERQIFDIHITARPDMFNKTSFNREYFEQCLNNERYKIFVYEEGAEILGFCITKAWEYKDHHVIHDMKVMDIEALGVEQSKRGQQIGRKLFEQAKQYANEMGISRIELVVWNFNSDAIAFYRNMGMGVRTMRMELEA